MATPSLHPPTKNYGLFQDLSFPRYGFHTLLNTVYTRHAGYLLCTLKMRIQMSSTLSFFLFWLLDKTLSTGAQAGFWEVTKGSMIAFEGAPAPHTPFFVGGGKTRVT